MRDETESAPLNIVQLGARRYRVTLSAESVGRSYYAVTFEGSPPRSWKAGEVSVNARSDFTCLKCRRHPLERPCIHVAIVRKFVAAQPLEVVAASATPANRRLAMLLELQRSAPKP